MQATRRSHVDEAQEPQGLRSVVGEGEEGHHQKTPVLKKVKDKAKKIMNTIKNKHGHDNDHCHGHGRDHNHEENKKTTIIPGAEEEGGYKEDTEDRPEIHGAPIYESKTTRVRDKAREGKKPEKAPVRLAEVLGEAKEDPGSPKGRSQDFVPGSYQKSVTEPAFTGAPEPGMVRSTKPASDPNQIKKDTDYTSPAGSHGKIAPQHQQDKEHHQQTYTDKISAVAEKATEQITAATTLVTEKATNVKDAIVSTAAEKLAPGQDDRALSGVISDAMHVNQSQKGEKSSLVGGEDEGGGRVERETVSSGAVVKPS